MEWPYLVLDIPENATDVDVRKAYLCKVQECPPEKDATRFSSIQRAYSLIQSVEKRSELKLFGLPEKPNSIADLIPDRKHLRKKIPMTVWLDELQNPKGVSK